MPLNRILRNRLFRALAALKARTVVTKIRPVAGDIVVLTAGGSASPDMAAFFARALKKQLPEGVGVAYLGTGMTLDHIPSDQLLRYGLYRLQGGEFRPKGPPNRLVIDGIQPEKVWPRA